MYQILYRFVKKKLSACQGETIVKLPAARKKFSNLKTKSSKLKTADLPSESEFRYAGPRPHTKEAAIVMLADAVESAIRTLSEAAPTRIETAVHNIAMKRLQELENITRPNN